MLDLIALNLITALAALLVAAALRVRPLRLLPVAALLLHVVVIQAFVLVTGLAGRLDMLAWRVFELALLILCAASLTAPGIKSELRVILLHARRIAAAIGALRLIAAAALLTAMALTLAVLGTLVGPYLPDVTTYHLAPPTDWIASGRIADHNWPDSRAWWPAGHSLLATWWMLPTRSLNFSVCANLHWIALAIGVSWTWARQLRCPPRVALLAACLVAALPILWAQAVSGLNDLAIAALVLGSIAPLITRRVRAPHFILSACFLLVAMGTKATVLPMAPPIVALAIFRFFLRDRIPAVRRPRAALLGRWGVLLLICVALGGFWYARNARVWGNPFYPATVQLGPIQFIGDHGIADKVGRLRASNLATNLPNLLMHRMWDDQKSVVRADVKRGSGFGVVAAGLGAVAMFMLLVAVPRSRPALLTVFGITLLVAAAVEPDDWYGRFFAFLALTMTICIAAIVPRLSAAPRAVWVTFIALAALPSILAGLSTTAPTIQRLYWSDHGLTTVPLAISAAFTEHGWIVDAAEKFPDDIPIVILSPNHAGPVGAMHGPTLRRHLLYSDQLPTPADLTGWRQAGARWLIIADTKQRLAAGLDLSTPVSWDFVLLPLGLRKLEEGVYEIP